MVNLPPRHGKSRTIGCFVEWVLGKNQAEKIMTGSYNETLSTTFSKGVRNTISEVKADKNKIVYSVISPALRSNGVMVLEYVEPYHRLQQLFGNFPHRYGHRLWRFYHDY